MRLDHRLGRHQLDFNKGKFMEDIGKGHNCCKQKCLEGDISFEDVSALRYELKPEGVSEATVTNNIARFIHRRGAEELKPYSR